MRLSYLFLSALITFMVGSVEVSRAATQGSSCLEALNIVRDSGKALNSSQACSFSWGHGQTLILRVAEESRDAFNPDGLGSGQGYLLFLSKAGAETLVPIEQLSDEDAQIDRTNPNRFFAETIVVNPLRRRMHIEGMGGTSMIYRSDYQYRDGAFQLQRVTSRGKTEEANSTIEFQRDDHAQTH